MLPIHQILILKVTFRIEYILQRITVPYLIFLACIGMAWKMVNNSLEKIAKVAKTIQENEKHRLPKNDTALLLQHKICCTGWPRNIKTFLIQANPTVACLTDMAWSEHLACLKVKQEDGEVTVALPGKNSMNLC